MFLRKCAVGDANIEDMQSEAPVNLLSHEIPGLSDISGGGETKTTNSAHLSSVIVIFTTFLRSDTF